MIRVTIELLNANKGGERSLLGVMHISNDGTGTDARCHYDGEIFRMDKVRGCATHVRTRQGRVENHPRHREVVWKLLQKMLNAMYPEKCEACDERNVG